MSFDTRPMCHLILDPCVMRGGGTSFFKTVPNVGGFRWDKPKVVGICGEPFLVLWALARVVVMRVRDEQAFELTPEVRAGDGVEEEVDAVVDVEDGARDEGHAPEVVHLVQVLEGHELDVARGQEKLTPRGEVGQVQGHEAEGDDEKDEGKLELDGAFLHQRPDQSLLAVVEEERPDDADVQDGYDDEGDESDADGVDGV